MHDVVITGASRGIGRALAVALAGPSRRLVLVARDASRLETLASEIRAKGGEALVVPGDVGTVSSATALGEALAGLVQPGSTLIHNAGLWPSRRQITADGLEEAYAVNFVGPTVMQQPLLASGKLARVMVVSAGLAIKGRFDPERTPRGEDFSSFRTYCTTKMCFASAMRDVAAEHPEIDVVVLHPGVVRTDLGARTGILGALLSLVKRRWESPETCAARLVRILERPRWSPPGDARWLVEEAEQPWPDVFEESGTRRSVTAAAAALVQREHAG
jgi:NAD(P)-dependent dehydrogenase (short-subunit alcohol dehydrogenase family)